MSAKNSQVGPRISLSQQTTLGVLPLVVLAGRRSSVPRRFRLKGLGFRVSGLGA